MTKKNTFATVALALSSLMIAARAEQASSVASMPIHQEVDYKASPQRVYKALLDSKQFSEWTGNPAQIRAEAGGAFNCFAGQIRGRNIELIPNQRIVQAWRVSGWPEGVYSIVRFELKAQGTGTHLILDHTGFAAADRDHLDPGWPRMYWDPLRKYFGE
jgi:activator of HSP90 ATPase